MAKYQKYVEYKDSGVRWLGAVPSHWIIAGFKKYLESTVDYRGKTPEKMDEGVFLVTARNIKNGIIDYSLSQEYVAFKDYDEIMSRGIPVLGDVLFTTEAPLGEVAQIDNVNIALAQRIIKFRGKKDILDNTYLKYFILSQEFQDSLMTFATGSTALGIKAERIGYLQQCIPPIHEQTQIAKFLDHETTKIDHLIEKQHQLIELLKEKRQAVISHAVTKGLDPNVPMKDSGVEWLGEVPEHWNVIAISKITNKITNGYVGPTRDILVPEGVPYVQATHIKKGKVNFDNAYFVREKWSNEHAKSILKHGDVLVVQTGAGTGDVGLVSANEEGFNCHALIILQSKQNLMIGSYLAYVLQSDYGYSTLYSIRTGGMHPHLNCGEVQFVKVPVPSCDEQEQIVKFIAKHLERYDLLIQKQEKAIQLMQERRTALISAAVTGKIDVRNWQAPTVAEAHAELSA